MVSKREKIAEYPIIASILVIVLYIAFIILGEILSIIAGIVLGEDALLSQTIRFVILASLEGFVLLYLVPKVLQLPSGTMTADEYYRKIRLDRQSAKPISRNAILALLYVSIFFVGLLVASVLTGEYTFQLDRILGLPDNEGNMRSFTFAFNLIPGVFEEIAYRGVILVLLLRKYSEKTAIVVSGVMFGISHLINALFSGYSWNTVSQVSSGVLIGLFFAYLVLRSGTLLGAIVIHYVYNALSTLFVVYNESDPFTYFIYKIIFAVIIPVIINGYIVRYFNSQKEATPEQSMSM